MTTTPFGTAVATFPTKTAFYDQYPALAQGWSVDRHPGTAPLGWDLVPGGGNQDPRWLVVFCTAKINTHGLEPTGRGAVVAFDRDKEVLHVLAEDLDFGDAKAQYQVN